MFHWSYGHIRPLHLIIYKFKTHHLEIWHLTIFYFLKDNFKLCQVGDIIRGIHSNVHNFKVMLLKVFEIIIQSTLPLRITSTYTIQCHSKVMYKHERYEIVIDICSPQNYVLYNSKLCVSMCSSKQVLSTTTFYIVNDIM
jgi:hypothetical protein